MQFHPWPNDDLCSFTTSNVTAGTRAVVVCLADPWWLCVAMGMVQPCPSCAQGHIAHLLGKRKEVFLQFLVSVLSFFIIEV